MRRGARGSSAALVRRGAAWQGWLGRGAAAALARRCRRLPRRRRSAQARPLAAGASTAERGASEAIAAPADRGRSSCSAACRRRPDREYSRSDRAPATTMCFRRARRTGRRNTSRFVLRRPRFSYRNNPPTTGNLTQHRHAALAVVGAVLDQAAEHDDVAVFDQHAGFEAALVGNDAALCRGQRVLNRRQFLIDREP